MADLGRGPAIDKGARFLDRARGSALDGRVDLAPSWVWLALGALAAFALLRSARLAWRDLARRYRLRRRARRAAIGERDAEPLLERAGYRVLGRQMRAELAYAVDGRPERVEVRADYLVERDGRAFVAEVKTGAEAPRIRSRATRRQLLEYAHAFEVAGVLLVDPERGLVQRVTLPSARASVPRVARDFALLVLGAAIGAAVALASRLGAT